MTPYGLPCPKCGHDETAVVDSRPQDGFIRRRRRCAACRLRFTTHERYELDYSAAQQRHGMALYATLHRVPIEARDLIVRLIEAVAGPPPAAPPPTAETKPWGEQQA